MLRLLSAGVVAAALSAAPAPAQADSPWAPRPSTNSGAFLYRGHNPGHIVGNTVRRLYWGSNYDSPRVSGPFSRGR